jgi:hypothetical protein
MPPRGYADLADLPEDERITLIVKAVDQGQLTAGVFVDDAVAMRRYEEKLLASGKVRIVSKGPSGVGSTYFLQVGPKGH